MVSKNNKTCCDVLAPVVALVVAIATPSACGGGSSTESLPAPIVLCTLTDGYDPSNPSAYNVPAQCQPIASL
jgi:hypothetical protein